MRNNDGRSPLNRDDVRELGGEVFFSQPTAVRERGDVFVLERRRERVSPGGERTCELDLISLDRVDPDALEREGASCGLRARERRTIPATADHVGSEVVILGV